MNPTLKNGRRWFAAAALALLAAAPLQTWLMLGGDFTEYLDHDAPAGQMPYLIAKLCALYAIELVWLQALLGLLRGRLAGAWFASPAAWRRVHRGLGLTALALVTAHVVLFVIATSLRNRQPAFDLLLPWGHGVYRTWVAFGAAAFLLILLAVAAQIWRGVAPRARLWVHRLVLLALGLVAIHSLAIGSESRSGAVFWAYVVMGATLAAALLDRYVIAGPAGGLAGAAGSEPT